MLLPLQGAKPRVNSKVDHEYCREKRVVSVEGSALQNYLGFLPGMTFYPGGMGISNKKKPLPKWFGRLLFVVVGLGFIYFGLRK